MRWRRSVVKGLTLGLLALTLAGCGALVSGRVERQADRAEASHPPEGQILDVGGVPVHAVVRGAGPDLVLIHGASGNTRDFTFSLVDQLVDRYRVIVFDRPGLGYTGHTDPKYAKPLTSAAESPAEQAALLAAAARQLGAERPLVLGQSYGGAVALAWGLDQPSAGLILLAAASNPWPGRLGLLYRVNGSALGGATAVPMISAFASPARVEEVLDSIFAPQSAPKGYGSSIGAGLSLRVDSLRANARQVNGLRPHLVEMVQRYPQISVPTELIHGDADTIVPLDIHSVPLSQQIPGARLTVLPGIGHMPHHVAAPAVIAAIDRAAARARLP